MAKIYQSIKSWTWCSATLQFNCAEGKSLFLRILIPQKCHSVLWGSLPVQMSADCKQRQSSFIFLSRRHCRMPFIKQHTQIWSITLEYREKGTKIHSCCVWRTANHRTTSLTIKRWKRWKRNRLQQPVIDNQLFTFQSKNFWRATGILQTIDVFLYQKLHPKKTRECCTSGLLSLTSLIWLYPKLLHVTISQLNTVKCDCNCNNNKSNIFKTLS